MKYVIAAPTGGPPTPCDDAKVDICLIIDSSGSIRDNNPPDGSDNWTTQLKFLSNLVGDFRVGLDATRVGAVVFSGAARLVSSLDRYGTTEEVQKVINNIAYMGQTTNTPDALNLARSQCFNPSSGDRSDVMNLAVIVTDGVPYPPNLRNPALDAAKALRNYGVTMIAVGITDGIDENFLKAMSSMPQLIGQNYFTAIDFSQLDTIRDTVVNSVCREAVPEPTPGMLSVLKVFVDCCLVR